MPSQLPPDLDQLDPDDDSPAGEPGSGVIERAVRDILDEIGEDPDREGLLRTPDRMHKMWLELSGV